jgi:hypothetical protein
MQKAEKRTSPLHEPLEAQGEKNAEVMDGEGQSYVALECAKVSLQPTMEVVNSRVKGL